MSHFSRAIVRKPSANFADGLTSVDLGLPDYSLALEQHESYCQALMSCGLDLLRLDADERYPDSTFVEDAAILIPECAIITRPGAESRSGEEREIEPVLRTAFSTIEHISAPGTLDGGDICEADGHVFIGLSKRTNDEGGRQLAEILARYGYSSTFVNVRNEPGILHLKSGISYLGGKTLLVIPQMAGREEFEGYRKLVVPDPAENYAANCILVNGVLIFPMGFLHTEEMLTQAGFDLHLVNVSEFAKMDGGLSCLSLRY